MSSTLQRDNMWRMLMCLGALASASAGDCRSLFLFVTDNGYIQGRFTGTMEAENGYIQTECGLECSCYDNVFLCCSDADCIHMNHACPADTYIANVPPEAPAVEPAHGTITVLPHIVSDPSKVTQRHSDTILIPSQSSAPQSTQDVKYVPERGHGPGDDHGEVGRVKEVLALASDVPPHGGARHPTGHTDTTILPRHIHMLRALRLRVDRGRRLEAPLMQIILKK
ncbi:uncharacterized protein LOC124115116 [Haliotis rufescens]|uniref:uncharacterized protein LOC124115116 n=1 Tax=Haliotis rufescens TaxID=6454 RepID=UPI00201F268F|nr:uncharacterized protein LOC124115116 [Haliotis rufescens]